jgi:diadenosine tetraphosphate (Ap4A) HIT family hydrolase
VNPFALDSRLQADTHWVLDAPLSRVLLMDDARWPWLILVPRRNGLRELLELDANERDQWFAELDACGSWLRQQPQVQKLNIGALGNVVAQLHVHVMGRWAADPAWPAPVWGMPGRMPYAADLLHNQLASLRQTWPIILR